MPIQHGSFGTAQMMSQSEAQVLENMVNNDFLKSLPKGTAKVASSILSMMLPDMSKTGAECPKQHVKRVMTNILKKYDQVVHLQNPQGLPAKAGEFVGEMFAFGAVGKVVRVAEGVSIFASACEGGLYGAILSESHETNRVAGIAFGFAGGGATTRILFKRDVPKPLLDRVFARPQGPSRQLPDFQRPSYHSGIGSPWAEMVPTQTLEKLKNSTSHLTAKELKSLEGRVSHWLGDGTKLIKNKAGDPVFLSQDKMRRVRFDFNNPHGDKLHLHFEKKVGKKWEDASSKHRIYPRDI